MKTNTTKITISLFAIATLGLTSCSKTVQTQEEIVAQNAKEYVQVKMTNPESYEFANLELVDSVLVIDNIKFRKISLHKQLEANLHKLYQFRDAQTENPSEEERNEVRRLKSQVVNAEQLLSKIDSIEVALGDKVKETASYTYRYNYRGKDNSGEHQLSEMFMQIGLAPDYKVLIVTGDRQELLQHANDFPGYQEVIQKLAK